MAAFLEEDFWMSFLEISGANLTGRNMRCDRNHRSIAAMSIEKTIDEVKVTRAATARAGRELSAQLSLRASRKGGGFFVAHMDPFEFAI
jgi:hypothetical protein